jgi:hypothetical protein
MTSSTSRLVRYAGTIAAAAAILSGCSQPSSGQPTAAETTAAETTARGPARATVSRPKAVSRTIEPGPRRCRASDVEAAVSPGDYPTPTEFHSAIVVRNTSGAACIVKGAGRLELHTGGNGADLGIKVVASADDTPQPVRLEPGALASMSVRYSTSSGSPVPSDCAENGVYAQVTLPDTSDPVEAWFPNRADGFPPVCGAVTVSSWGPGGAPGVFGN